MNRDELQQLDKEFLIDMIISKEQMLIHYKGEYQNNQKQKFQAILNLPPPWEN